MDDIRFYTQLYHILEGVSPLRFDCGRLCGAACCQTESELPGMYLFPGEEAMFKGRAGFRITSSDLPGYGQVLLLSCSGECARPERPLACRVFPLAPGMDAGKTAVRLDPRGRRACPLCRDTPSALSADFSAAVLGVFTALAAEPRTADFLRALARHLDEFAKPL